MRLKGLVALAAFLTIIGSGTAVADDANPWTGTFDGFNGADWASHWGVTVADTHNWGWEQLSTVADPDQGTALQAFYGKGSGAHSCWESGECASPGGGQFYASFHDMGRDDLLAATTVDLRYYLKFSGDFDFGRAGKLPGFYGGEPGTQSGCDHGGGWSTRYMWRVKSGIPKGEVYWYAPDGSGCGADLGLGDWNWSADGQWHAVEQQVDRSAGTITVWYDGVQVSQQSVSGLDTSPVTGIFFSTFFGGSDNTWGPGHDVQAYYANFAVDTAYIGP